MNKNVKIGDEKETEYKKQAEKEKKIIQKPRREKESPAGHEDYLQWGTGKTQIDKQEPSPTSGTIEDSSCCLLGHWNM